MASDRGAALILQAAARGIVDFSKFDPLDRKWWPKLKWMLRELERDNRRQLLQMQHTQHVGAMTRGDVQQHWREATKTLDELVAINYPWLRPNKGPKTKEEEISEARGMLAQKYGDPKTPEGAERIRKTVEYLRAARGNVKPPAIRPKRTKR